MDRSGPPDGRSLLLSGSQESETLWSRLSEGGAYVKLAAGVDHGIGGSSWSPDGSEIAFVKVTPEGRDIWKVDAAGEAMPLTEGGMAADGASVRWSPTEELVAFVSKAGDTKRLWTVPAQGGEPRPLATPGEVQFASWSPDGRRLAVAAGTLDSTDIWIVPVDGGEAGLLVAGPGVNTQPDWSPDGSGVVFASNRPRPEDAEPSWNIWHVAATGGEVSLLVAGDSPQWSHDGSDILHLWRGDIWRAPVAGNGLIDQLGGCSHPCSHPRWSPDGSKVLYGWPGHGPTDIWIVDAGP